MKKNFAVLGLSLLILAASAVPGRAAQAETTAETQAAASGEGAKVAGSADMASPVELEPENLLAPIPAEQIKDGVYEINVFSSSSMFRIESCTLTVEDGVMTAVMDLGSTSYLYLYPGTGEEASADKEENYIHYVEDADGSYTFAFPVEGLNLGIPCAAFSKKKEMWYDRTLVFQSDALPADAFADGVIATAETLGLEDGVYTIEVALEGGSGRASVESPARLTVADGEAIAEIIWGSSHYDYMKVDGVQYDQVNTEGNSAFEIPVTGFDFPMPVIADTTAMSVPYEIDYTLFFDSSSIQEAAE